MPDGSMTELSYVAEQLRVAFSSSHRNPKGLFTPPTRRIVRVLSTLGWMYAWDENNSNAIFTYRPDKEPSRVDIDQLRSTCASHPLIWQPKLIVDNTTLAAAHPFYRRIRVAVKHTGDLYLIEEDAAIATTVLNAEDRVDYSDNGQNQTPHLTVYRQVPSGINVARESRQLCQVLQKALTR